MKKGQAAIEFLMTYGWAILAAVIAIGVLAYFGVFSPGKFAAGTAIVNAPFYVNAWNVKPAGVTLELKNNGGESYTIGSVIVGNCGTLTPEDPLAIAASAAVPVTVLCDPVPVVGASFQGDITISYTKVGSTVALTSTGTIAEKVTA